MSGKFGFSRNTELYSTEKKIESEQLSKLLDLKNITIMAVRQDAGFIYDPENYFLSQSFYPVSNGQSCYFNESDYRNGTKKSIEVSEVSSESQVDFQQIQNDELFRDGIRKIENLMETGIPENSEIYLFSSNLAGTDPDILQVKIADEILMENDLVKKRYQICIPALSDILSYSLTHFQTLLVSAAGIAFTVCMMFELFLLCESRKISRSALFFRFLIMGSICGILELVILFLKGYGLLSLNYSMDSVLFIWSSSGLLWLAFTSLFRILSRLSTTNRCRILSLIKGLGLGGVITVDSVLLSALIRSLTLGPGPDTLFILFCLIVPLFTGYVLLIRTLLVKQQTEAILDKDRIQSTACSIILISLAAFIGMSFVSWSAAIIAVLLLIPVFWFHPKDQLVKF